jgi:osmotically-inducible protein OsmY
MQAGQGVPSSGALWEEAPLSHTFETKEKRKMKVTKALAIALLAGATLAGTGCAVVRGQSTAGAYVDDVSITTAVKAKFVEDKSVDATAINVHTLNGTVQLSGFAKSAQERSQAEAIARGTKGVRAVQNAIAVRP